jgi:hypothetical protein
MGVHPTHRQLKTSGFGDLDAGLVQHSTAGASGARSSKHCSSQPSPRYAADRGPKNIVFNLSSPTTRANSLAIQYIKISIASRICMVQKCGHTISASNLGWRPQIQGLPSRSRRGVPDNGSAMLPNNRARSSSKRSRSVAFRLGQNNNGWGHGEGGGANLEKLAARRLIFLHRTFLLWLTGNLVFDNRVNSTIRAPRASANNPKPKFGNAETCRPVPLKADAERPVHAPVQRRIALTAVNPLRRYTFMGRGRAQARSLAERACVSDASWRETICFG